MVGQHSIKTCRISVNSAEIWPQQLARDTKHILIRENWIKCHRRFQYIILAPFVKAEMPTWHLTAAQFIWETFIWRNEWEQYLLNLWIFSTGYLYHSQWAFKERMSWIWKCEPDRIWLSIDQPISHNKYECQSGNKRSAFSTDFSRSSKYYK